MISKFDEIIEKLNQINPVKYSKDRNFIDGSVSKLSPYISRGIISTKFIYKFLILKGYRLNQIEKFVQELTWRDYWQKKWQKHDINKDIKNKQKNVYRLGMPKTVFDKETKIKIFDKCIGDLYDFGYLHNHMRMYIASYITNVGGYHWKTPSKWMYYYLLDADWGSNALSWQWICGTNSNKKYYANQDNINKFTKTHQKNTILDQTYEDLTTYKDFEQFNEKVKFDLKTNLPKSDIFINTDNKPICIYNFYNLDPNWRQDIDAHRILLIEPSVFEKYPICENSMNFMLSLAKNIPKMKVIVSEFKNLPINKSKVFFKEHPLNINYFGTMDSREWLVSDIYYESFFKYWKNVKKELLKIYN